MVTGHRLYYWLLCIFCLAQSALIADDRATSAKLAQHARSILSNRCFACHGPDQTERQAGLRLDEASSMFRPADSGEQPVMPGNPEQSELLRRIVTEDEDERMPPADFGQRLLPEEVQAIR